MSDENKIETPVETVKEEKFTKLAKATYSFMGEISGNPYSPSDVDKMDLSKDLDWKDVIALCKFFYKHEPLASTVSNKLIDIAINDLTFDKNGISDNELKIFEGIKEKLRAFAEQLALEYLLSGLVVPEFRFGPVTKRQLRIYGVKKYDTLTLPVSLWVRDPATIVINKTIISDLPSYFVEVPDEMIYFISHKGVYTDGTKDKDLYNTLQTYYPDFVSQIDAGQRKILLTTDPNLIIRRRVTTDTAYPTPFLFPALEAMKHKRNLRRMDYSIAARIISAIMLVRLGSDDFPITEDDTEAFTDIQKQLLWRDSSNRNVERVFQLFANHTLKIDWVFPPADALLSQTKYDSVNEDILVALGFPRILITGESQRSQTSDAAYATSGPVKTMESMRKSIEFILNYVVEQVSELNNLRSTPAIRFAPLRLSDYSVYMASLKNLYDSGNLSRESYAEELGFSWDDEIQKKIKEEKLLVDSGLPEFSPLPNSRAPTNTSSVSPMDQTKGDNINNQQLKQETQNAKASSDLQLNNSIDKLIVAMAENQNKTSNIRLDLSPVTFSMPENKPPVVNITMPEQAAAQITVQNNIPEQSQLTPNYTFSPNITVPPSEVTLNVPPAEVTIQNNIPAPEVTVNNTVPTPEITINNSVPVPDVTVNNNVATPEVSINNTVPVPEVKIDNTYNDSKIETIAVNRVDGKIVSMTKTKEII